MNAKIIAYYLPQFHPFKENDEWWGKGFTEWTNVGKAKKFFKNHYQPKVPADLGYYDLRIPEVRQMQADLAKEAGIEGFCYWHYWFGDGKQLMNSIIDDVHKSGKPNFPFCLGWANETWKAKQWNKDGSGDKILMEQKYDGEKDYRLHFNYVKKLFNDSRYIKVDGCPFFLIYKPFAFDDVANFIKSWNKWVKEEGIADHVYFVANLDDEKLYDVALAKGFDAITFGRFLRVDYHFNHMARWRRGLLRKLRSFRLRPHINNMKTVNKHMWLEGIDDKETTIPFLLPNWDHTPRSGMRGDVIVGATPEEFKKQAELVISNVQKKDNKIIMLKSWNEWAEGNYMEPDLKFHRGFIDALRDVVNKYKK